MAGVCSTSGRSCPLLGYPSRGWTQHMLSVTASVHTPFVPRVTLQRPSQSPADYNLHCLQGSHRCILVWSSEANQQLVTEQQSLPQAAPSTSAPADPTVAAPAANKQPGLMSKIFGTYLVLAVWVAVLVYGGYRGLQTAAQEPAAAGLLLAPPATAALLVVTFLMVRLGSKDYDTRSDQ